MLEKVDLSKKIPKEEYKSLMEGLEIRLGELQRKAQALKFPVIIAFEGWDAAGKGTLISNLIQPLDPRGFKVHAICEPTPEERMRPFLWRFWVRLPEGGRIGIFDRSWYGRVLVERVDKITSEKIWRKGYSEIRDFERQLTDDNAVIIKLFLHIDKKEQKKRFKHLESNHATEWKINKSDWKHHKEYDKYMEAYEDMIAETDTENAPWNIIESHDERFATFKIFKIIADTLESAIQKKEKDSAGVNIQDIKNEPSPDNLNSSIIRKIDLNASITDEEYKSKLKDYQMRFRELEHQIYLKRVPVVIVYEGSDAAGKGGNIKRMTQELEPRGYEVTPVAAPNDVEKAHHYLWRFWRAFPKAGHITIFDRSWYGRVLVERVEGFCSREAWKRAYKEINQMEEQWAAFGAVIVKFWLQIDKDEQLKRFEARQLDTNKTWKITEEDWRNREKWDLYLEAVDEMLFRTSTPYAPWTIVESNNKYYARIKTLKTVIDFIEAKINVD